MTPDVILDGLCDREGQGVPPYITKGDAGGRTSWGISERAHPEAWKNGPPTREQARALYTARYVAPFDFMQKAGYDDRLRAQLIDFSVNSGIGEAIACLDRVLDLSADPLGLNIMPSSGGDRHINNELLAERAVFLHGLARRVPNDKQFDFGWATRLLSFYWAPVERNAPTT